ncbi:MAG: hypothetical protein AB7E76_07940 [Deferribacterales bacterium]
MTNNQDQNAEISIFKAEMIKFCVLFAIIACGALAYGINTGQWMDSLKISALLSFTSMIYAFASYMHAMVYTEN